MGIARLVATLIALGPAGSALAAPAADPQASSPVTLPTLFSPVPRSLQQLIGDGYQVVNIAIGLSGFGYLLKQDAHYVTCAVQPDHARAGAFVSECRAMN